MNLNHLNTYTHARMRVARRQEELAIPSLRGEQQQQQAAVASCRGAAVARDRARLQIFSGASPLGVALKHDRWVWRAAPTQARAQRSVQIALQPVGSALISCCRLPLRLLRVLLRLRGGSDRRRGNCNLLGCDGTGSVCRRRHCSGICCCICGSSHARRLLCFG